MASAEHESVGIVGVGVMGFAMATNLHAAGYRVFGFDPVPDAQRRLREMGGVAVGSPREVAEQCSTILFSLPSAGALADAVGGENGVAVFAIDKRTGEPGLIQNIDGLGIHLRKYGIDPSGRLLIAASIMPLPIRVGDGIGTLTAGITLFRIGNDGRLTLVRKHDIDTAKGQQFWSGMAVLVERI